MVSISLADPTVQSYIFYSGILALKLLFVGVLTGIQRHKKNVFANEEDAKGRKGVVKFNDEDVERPRRSHLNDLENIPAFWILGALYLTTGPSAALATWLFRIYTVGRVMFTYVYAINPLPPPTRSMSFGIPYFITLYMGFRVIQHYVGAL
ncbi:microsomal glutathione S-transferase 1-like [Anticarsia gemmatalis]|uniref:microsomal glutathione S-transferase 1-like n=1 Tax=Anticarsia gemmatalis TaxID=129554 RepID=UPI003F768F9C